MDILNSPTQAYRVGEKVGETDEFTLYECILPDGKIGILKIATDKKHNGALDREVFVLQTLREQADRVEALAAEHEPGKGELGYRHFFPELIEGFISADQGDRYVLILGFSEVADKLSDLTSLEDLVSEERKRVDPKTSVWIMGKLLKLLDFAHRQGVSVTINSENVLINRDRHKVIVFNWSSSTIVVGPVPDDAVREEISQAALEVITVLGGNIETGELPANDQLTDGWYQELLWSLACGDKENAGEAHTQFYNLVLPVWPNKFHPFTAFTVKTTTTTETSSTEEEV